MLVPVTDLPATVIAFVAEKNYSLASILKMQYSSEDTESECG